MISLTLEPYRSGECYKSVTLFRRRALPVDKSYGRSIKVVACSRGTQSLGREIWVARTVELNIPQSWPPNSH